MGAEGQISAAIEPWLPVIGAVLGMAAVIIIQQVVQRQVRRFMQSREREAETIKNHRYASVRTIALTVARAYEDVTLRGKVLTHLELYLLIHLHGEYKLLGGNGAAGWQMEQILAAHGYGSESWEQYRKLGSHLQLGGQEDRAGARGCTAAQGDHAPQGSHAPQGDHAPQTKEANEREERT